jgi:DNA helicase-2/ATP-dependent DNA helicase PcrA
LKSAISLLEWANALVDETGIIPLLKSESSPESMNRIDNIRELQRAIADYATNTPGATIEGFLEQVALVSDIDSWNDKSNAVSLMTLHSAKGLEFPVVFMVGLEDGLFPLSRSFEEPADLEEERRLFYVGATRAKDKLYLSWAAQRVRMGQRMVSEPSRFLRELDQQFIAREGRRPRLPAASADFHQTRHAEQRMPKYEDESQEIPGVEIGQRVRHELFGVGKIVSADGHGENTKVTVRFADAGTKKLVLKYANLQFL